MTNNRYSRRARYHKRRNNQRILILFSSLAVITIIVLLSVVALNKPKSKGLSEENESIAANANQSEQDDISQEDEQVTDLGLAEETNAGNTENNNDGQSESESLQEHEEKEVEIEVIEHSDDDNVIRTYVADWPPIGTSQTGSRDYDTNFSKDSEDQREIRRAIERATGIEEEEMVVWRVGNNGFQKVFSVITEKQTDEIYRIFLSWVDDEGWQVTKVENIKESEWVKN